MMFDPGKQMLTRSVFFTICFFIILALGVCSFLALRSKKAIGRTVAMTTFSFIPPIIGNMIIIISGSQLLSEFGYYVYFTGMNLVIFSLSAFTVEYCNFKKLRRLLEGLSVVFLLDAAQLLLNPVLRHAFDTEAVIVDGFNYYRLLPHLGQSIHRIIDYGVLAAIIVLFIYKIIHTSRIYTERYLVIFLTIMVTLCWESYYIFSRTPVDRSMIGFGVSGILMFYFSIYYKPVRLLDRMLVKVISDMPEAMFFFEAGGLCVWANKPGIRLLSLQGKSYDAVRHHLRDDFNIELSGSDDWVTERICGDGPDSKYYVIQKSFVSDNRGRNIGFLLSVRDDTDAHNVFKREKHNATHDRLTGMYNREYLYEQIRLMIDSYPEKRFAVLYIDVKDFKIVNDVFGTDFGDKAICALGEWIAGMVPESGVYGRIGGDTFGACIPVEDFDADAFSAGLEPFVVRSDPFEHNMSVHIGVYEVTEPELEVSVMLDRAHIAMSTIENDYQTHLAWYDETMRNRMLWSQRITADLAAALEEGQIRPYFQPIVDSKGHTVGAEALARWVHPDKGFLSPAMFVPIFEENGLIAQVDRHIWRRACAILADWQKKGYEQFISVNISPKDFYFMDVAEEIRQAVKDYNVPHNKLRFEITETVMMTDMENRVHILESLRDEGFQIEMDDFGSGYSSLNLLKDMPVDVIKIDMRFLSCSKHEMKAQRILNNIVRMSDDIGIVPLVEGVETREQYGMLSNMHCQFFQGYYFAKPMPIDEFEREWLNKDAGKGADGGVKDGSTECAK